MVSSADETPAHVVRQAAAAVDAGQPDAALRLLDAFPPDHRARYVDGVGSVAYWRGRAYAHRGDSVRALRTWQAGWAQLAMNGRFDPRLNDAYARMVVRTAHTERMAQAASAYLQLFEQARQAPDDGARRVVGRSVSQMASLLAEAKRSQWLEREDASDGPGRIWTLREGAGPELAAWWRSQDPVPTTARNEAVEEHIRRVLHAERTYAYDQSLRGYDDRGAIYVRLGPPPSVRDVALDLDRYKLDNLRQFEKVRSGAQASDQASGGGSGSGSDQASGGGSGSGSVRRGSRTPILNIETEFPEHEIWVYPAYGESAHFTFIKRQGRYQLARPDELLPRSLRPPYSASDRGAAGHALLVLESIYRTYTFDAAYASRYEELNFYLTEPPPDIQNIQPAQRPRPVAFAQVQLLNGKSTSRRQVHARAQIVPTRRTAVDADLERVPLALRTARFLDADGSTRTLFYWAHPPGALGDESHLMNATAVQLTPDVQPQIERSKRYVLAPSNAGLDVRSLPISGRTGRFHLRLQIDQYAIVGQTGAGQIRRGAQTGRTVVRIDSVDALSDAPNRLVLSDLLPGTLVPPDSTQADVPGAMGLKPYPLSTLQSGRPLTFYFEAYHLAFGPDDRTRYTVEYRVERRTEGGPFRLFRDRTEETATATTYEGTASRAQEYIQLGLQELTNADQVRITVRLTDEVGGQTAERSITFEVAP